MITAAFSAECLTVLFLNWADWQGWAYDPVVSKEKIPEALLHGVIIHAIPTLASKLLAIGLSMRSGIFLERAWKFPIALLLKPVGQFHLFTEQIMQLQSIF